MFFSSRQQATATLFYALLFAGAAIAQTTERVSVDSSGAQANSYSYNPSISSNGNFVAFDSMASNLVGADGNSVTDVFVHDSNSGITERVSLNSSGAQANGHSYDPSISANGRYVAFHSGATDLVSADSNPWKDVFVHDRLTGITTRISVDSAGGQGNGDSVNAAISADGRFVAFESVANNLVAADANGAWDIFVHDLTTGTTERVSIGTSGEANGNCLSPTISADGRHVAFSTDANNLVAGDLNGRGDIFLRDRTTATTELISVDSFAAQGDNHSAYPSISADGNAVAFDSWASNLVSGDTNGGSDIFVRDRLTGSTERVSMSSMGVEADSGSEAPSISADGMHVSFLSYASNLIPGDTNSYADVFVHDRATSITQRVSVSSLGAQSNGFAYFSAISADGSQVAFYSNAQSLVPGDTNLTYDIFVHQRWNGMGKNSIYLDGPLFSPVGAPLQLDWYSAPASSNFWLVYSLNQNGLLAFGHQFDVGAPYTMLATGVNSAAGSSSFISAPVPAAAAGLTINFEVAASGGGGVLYDSNVWPVIIL
jgi:hypothetical protein